MAVPSVVPRLRRMARALGGMSMYGWMYGSLALFIAGLTLFYMGPAIDVLRAQYLAGVPGHVTVVDCQWTDRAGFGWGCSGEFVSDDGRLRLPEVEIRPRLEEWPADPVPTLVSGASASVAHLPDPGQGWIRLMVLPVFAYLIWLTARIAWEDARDNARDRDSPSDPPGRIGSSTTLPLPPHEADAVTSSGEPPQCTSRPPPEPPAPVPPNPVAWALVVWWMVLLLSVVAVIWTTVLWNWQQDASLAARATAQVTATHLGSENRIEVEWTDHTGQGWLSRFTPLEPERFSVGDHVDLRYHPERPDEPYPVASNAFDLPPRDRNVWTGLLLVPGVLLSWAWTWRLGRWALGAMVPARPVESEVLVAVVAWAGKPMLVHVGGTLVTQASAEPTAFWVRLRDEHGRLWHQRVLYHRRLAGTATPGRVSALARRCPGLRRMFVVDIPGVARLWPASTARMRPPNNYDLEPFDPRRRGETHRDGPVAILLGGGGLAAFAAGSWWLAGPALAAYLLALAGSYWFWAGATPWKGLYSYRPEAPPPPSPGMYSPPPTLRGHNG